MKTFFSSLFGFPFIFSFNKDFPLIFTDAILINFHLKEIFFFCFHFFQCRRVGVAREFSTRISPEKKPLTLWYFNIAPLVLCVLNDKTLRASVSLSFGWLWLHFFCGFGFFLVAIKRKSRIFYVHFDFIISPISDSQKIRGKSKQLELRHSAATRRKVFVRWLVSFALFTCWNLVINFITWLAASSEWVTEQSFISVHHS